MPATGTRTSSSLTCGSLCSKRSRRRRRGRCRRGRCGRGSGVRGGRGRPRSSSSSSSGARPRSLPSARLLAGGCRAGSPRSLRSLRSGHGRRPGWPPSRLAAVAWRGRCRGRRVGVRRRRGRRARSLAAAVALRAARRLGRRAVAAVGAVRGRSRGRSRRRAGSATRSRAASTGGRRRPRARGAGSAVRLAPLGAGSGASGSGGRRLAVRRRRAPRGGPRRLGVGGALSDAVAGGGLPRGGAEPPACAPGMAAISSPLRIRAVPEMPRSAARRCSSGSSIAGQAGAAATRRGRRPRSGRRLGVPAASVRRVRDEVGGVAHVRSFPAVPARASAGGAPVADVGPARTAGRARDTGRRDARRISGDDTSARFGPARGSPECGGYAVEPRRSSRTWTTPAGTGVFHCCRGRYLQDAPAAQHARPTARQIDRPSGSDRATPRRRDRPDRRRRPRRRASTSTRRPGAGDDGGGPAARAAGRPARATRGIAAARGTPGAAGPRWPRAAARVGGQRVRRAARPGRR